MTSTAATETQAPWLKSLPLPGGRRRIRIQLGRIGRVRTELCGGPCPRCGSSRCQVVLHRGLSAGAGVLISRCTRCRVQRDLDREGMIEAVLFRYGLKPASAAMPRPFTPASPA